MRPKNQVRAAQRPVYIVDDDGGRPQDRGTAMKGGAVDFIEKPFNDEGLLGAINAALAVASGPTSDRESLDAAQRIAGLSPRER
jgi:DNA-binding response OmpR family regulator